MKHHVAFRSFQLGTGSKSTVENLNQWADKLVTENKMGILMTHAISHGYAQLTDSEILRGHFNHVKSRGKDIWVDTFANISRYERERDDAKVELTGKTGSVTCVLTSSLDPQLYDVPLTIVLNVKEVKEVSAKRDGKVLPARVGSDTIQIDAAPGALPIMVLWK